MEESQSKTITNDSEYADFTKTASVASLLNIFSTSGATGIDRCRILPFFVVGRGPTSDWVVNDNHVSKRHFCITEVLQQYWITDLDSKNGTYVNGHRLLEKSQLGNNDIIRAGNLLFVFIIDTGEVLKPLPLERFNIAGDFHASAIIDDIQAAALSNHNILISGPSGTGKELVATGLFNATCRTIANAPFIVHNAARFSSEEEATTTLFGVGAKVFSDVSAKAGLIEQADNGVLFLDEVHNFPERVQRTLLRIIEDSRVTRIGDSKSRKIRVKFVLASNADAPEFGLAHDLLARLRKIEIPPLSKRVADIPSIFDKILEKELKHLNLDYSQVKSALKTEHYEALCLDGFKQDNVRGLIRVADQLATSIGKGLSPEKAVHKIFWTSFKNSPVLQRLNGGSLSSKQIAGPFQKNIPSSEPEPDHVAAESGSMSVSHYERNKAVILHILNQTEYNVSQTIRMLNQSGIRCSRRWLDIYLEKWGIDRRRYRPRQQ